MIDVGDHLEIALDMNRCIGHLVLGEWLIHVRQIDSKHGGSIDDWEVTAVELDPRLANDE